MAQRARLQEKSTPPPHVLAMTATPIPRTLALAVHGDMAVCAIDELPPGRLPVITHALHDSATDRKRVRHYCWERLRRQWGQPRSVHRQPAVTTYPTAQKGYLLHYRCASTQHSSCHLHVHTAQKWRASLQRYNSTGLILNALQGCKTHTSV